MRNLPEYEVVVKKVEIMFRVNGAIDHIDWDDVEENLEKLMPGVILSSNSLIYPAQVRMLDH